MPSEASVIDLLQHPIATYRSYVAAARERVRTLLSTETGADRARLELGVFGGSRIDVARFAELRRGAAVDALSRMRLERAGAVLAEIDAAGNSIFTANVLSGDSLRVVVGRALARAGRAFGAANVADLVRGGRYEPERHDRMLESFGFEWWSKTEREHAPPLVVTVGGADLRAGALADLLDVGTRIVLLVHGPSTPAPLIRLVTPGSFVMQTREPGALARAASSEGPAIAALFEEEAALFTHDPRAGTALWQRLTIAHRPTDAPKKAFAGISARQQREELLQLDALAARPVVPDGSVEALVPAGPGDPADRLTAWLLSESGFAGET